ncbi:MAG TPA: hypothetical protein ENG56_00755 [Candidatus Aenigmarchaeota archaeon]|nr:hypothetical protein [Candidatus Aenigmarchaeota archaeon]
MKGAKKLQDTLDEGLEKTLEGKGEGGLVRKIEEVEKSEEFWEEVRKVKGFLYEKTKELEEYLKSKDWGRVRSVCEHVREFIEEKVDKEVVREVLTDTIKGTAPFAVLYAVESLYPGLPREAALAIKGATTLGVSIYFNKKLREKWMRKWKKYDELSKEHGERVMFGYYKSLGKGRERIERWRRRALQPYRKEDGVEIFVPDLTARKVRGR